MRESQITSPVADALFYGESDRLEQTEPADRCVRRQQCNPLRTYVGRIANGSLWVEAAGLDSSIYGTHSMRRTKATLIYKRTKNLRAVQLLLGHTKLESTVRYLGIEVDDALEISEQTEI